MDILTFLLEIKQKQAAIEEDVKNLHKIVEKNNRTHHLQAETNKAELKEAIAQYSMNMEKAMGQCSTKIDETISILDNFQLIRALFKL